jgi:hypothetical protein
VIRTRNLVAEWKMDTGRLEPALEVQGVPESWSRATRVQGLEDVRWVVHGGRIWFTATCLQVPGAEGRCRVVLGCMKAALDAVEHLVPLHYDGASEVEKNWLLWPAGDELSIVYAYEPFTVLGVDPGSGTARVHEQHPAPWCSARFRGSAGPTAIPERPGHWLALVHEVAVRDQNRIYAHRWIELASGTGMVAYSAPFVFDHAGIEYAAGLLDNGDDTLTITYGFEDREARWTRVDGAAVLASLRPAA